ncbi:hypothetical protein [Alteribacillus sp. YIM 98480]|uniref:hypothetical protein n=1 Tax=Alteribacillus sp. YIM 98480 TaxID=2606599 RepID=UPI00131BB21C|nr:hypothetical protein [Alteribacillus sp. YIM 98480]
MGVRVCPCAELIAGFNPNDPVMVRTTCGNEVGDFVGIINENAIRLRIGPPDSPNFINICCDNICAIRELIPE